MIKTKEEFDILLNEMQGWKTAWFHDIINRNYVVAFWDKEPTKRVIVAESLATEVRKLKP